MRFFTQLSYNGSSYHGWQFQQNTISTIQGVLESALHTIGRKKIPIVGCGRTDAGVHASDYYFHFDDDSDWQGKEYKLNSLLPKDIAIKKINLVHEDAHARFDATLRTYHYHLHTFKDPFSLGMSYCYKQPLDLSLLNEAAGLILEYQDFETFCKSGSDVENKRCDLFQSEWSADTNQHHYTYIISANRFLRGMVRLIVGMCINVNAEKIDLAEVKNALDNRELLSKSWSAPAEGLFLSEIKYPYIDAITGAYKAKAS